MALSLRTWTEIGSPAATLIAGGNDLYATNPDTGDIWQWNGTPYEWTCIGTPGHMFVAGAGTLSVYRQISR